MTGTELKTARRAAGWTQARLAAHLEVTQAYVCLLESGRRRVPARLARRLTTALRLSPTTLPMPSHDDVTRPTTNAWVQRNLARLGYPGYAHERRTGAVAHPMEVLLRALSVEDLDPRLAEALPWLLLHFGSSDPAALVERARSLNVQNRLGFVAALALDVVESGEDHAHRGDELRRLLERLEPYRLAREDTLGQPGMSAKMRDWVRRERSEAAAHWNILTDLVAEQLSYAS